MAVVFVLLVFLVQVGFLMSARATAQAAADSFAARAELVMVDESALADELRTSLPGARDVEVNLQRDSGFVSADVYLDWDPPGPSFLSIPIRVRGLAPVIDVP